MQVPFFDPLLHAERRAPVLPLVGRERELFLIHTLLDNVAHDLPSGPRALTISGEMGVGKTRLLAEMCQEAKARHFRVLSASAYESGSMFPYFPFIEALRPLLRASTPEQLRHYLGLVMPLTPATEPHEMEASISLTPAQLVTSLARLFPELPKIVHMSATQELLSPDQEKFRLFDTLATLLERMGREQPILLCIDGLQWADSASLELTMYLTVRLHTSRVALVGVTRPQRVQNWSTGDDEPRATSASAVKALGDLMRYGLLFVLPLGPLDEDASARYLHALLPGELPQDVGQPLLTRAEGNPFFLEELVRALTLNEQLVEHEGIWQTRGAASTKLPDSIIEAVSRRLLGLKKVCYQMLQIAALFGRTFPVDVLTHVMGRNEEEVDSLIDEAVQASIITTPTYSFCQGIVQEVLQSELAPHRARELHRAIARGLEASYGDEAVQHAAELARHYAAGGEREATLRWSLLAGEDAASQQAYREAISHFRLMLKLLTQGEPLNAASLPAFIPSITELYITLGDLWFKLGELEQAASAFQQALQHAQQTPHIAPLLLARANRLLADVYRIQVKYDQTLAHLQAAHEALKLEQAEGVEEHARITVPWYPGRSFAPAPSQARLEQINAGERVLFLQSQALLDLLLNRPAQAEEAFWESHRQATRLGDRQSQAFALHMVGYLRGWGEQIFEAIRLQETANEMYVALGDPFRAVLGDQGLGMIYLVLGDIERARLYTLRGMERARRYGIQRIIGSLHWNLGALALVQGQWESCESHLQQALQEATLNNDARLKPAVLQTQAELSFRHGNWSEAERLFLDSIHAGMSTEYYPGTLALYGHFLAVTGRRAAARAQLAHASETTEPPGFAGHFYIPFLAEGYLHLDEPERAATYLKRISTLHGFMYYGHSVDRILGEVAARAGDWETAERAFEESLILCTRAHNEPEMATIYYEQARTALMRGDDLSRVHELCDRARVLFLQYDMQRAADMVETLREGTRQLAAAPEPQKKTEPAMQTGDYVLDQHLTKRELEVLQLVAEGHTDREVAETLVISPRTVNRHLSNVFVKLDVPGRAAAVAYALRRGLV